MFVSFPAKGGEYIAINVHLITHMATSAATVTAVHVGSDVFFIKLPLGEAIEWANNALKEA